MANRIIKRFRNRRLYDFGQSKYVTLKHVRDLVIQGVDLEVVDHDGKTDITSRVLLQVLTAEVDGWKDSLISAGVLCRMIRSKTFRAKFAREFMLESGSGG